MIATAMLVMVSSIPAGIKLSVDPNTSYIDVEICVQGECDSDATAIDGFLVIDLDCFVEPDNIALQDFDFEAQEDLNFHLDYRFLGDIYATAKDLALYHADPGGQPFVPLTNGEFAFTNVPFLKRGTVEYRAEGLICGILRGLGIPCEDSVNLADDPPGIFETIGGSIEIDNGIVRLGSRLDFDEFLDPENPDLGRIRGTAVLNASGQVPNVADLDDDNDVDLVDFAALQLCFGGPGNPPGEACPEGVDADLDCDDDVDLDDYVILHARLTGP